MTLCTRFNTGNCNKDISTKDVTQCTGCDKKVVPKVFLCFLSNRLEF